MRSTTSSHNGMSIRYQCRRCTTILAWTLLLGLAAGCGGDSANRLPVYKVRGKVSFVGAPVIGADVTFFNEETQRSAFGKTDDRGEFELTTYGANDGAVAGKHTVKIVQLPPTPPSPTFVDIESEDYVPPGLGTSTEPPAPKSTLPQKYGDFATSGLIAMVNTDVEINEVSFELKN